MTIKDLNRLKQTTPISNNRGVLFVDWISDKRIVSRAYMMPLFVKKSRLVAHKKLAKAQVQI